MATRLYNLIRNLLFLLEPEKAHRLALSVLKLSSGLDITRHLFPFQYYPKRVMGLNFQNPVGLAAGYDKNAENVDCLGDLGFGFIEVGTVTPLAQNGNSRPRVFRLPKVNGIINHMGFPNVGSKAVLENLSNIKRYQGILGVNIGKNKETSLEDAVTDYISCIRCFYARADYIAVNISSPNTQGLRDMQDPQYLRGFLRTLKVEQGILADSYGKYVPLVVKLSPDIDTPELQKICVELIGAKIDGVIATNTSTSRDAVVYHCQSHQEGGLSGAPITKRSLTFVGELARFLDGHIPIIGSGGVMDEQDARAIIDAGASLIQLYTGLVYAGPTVIARVIGKIRE